MSHYFKRSLPFCLGQTPSLPWPLKHSRPVLTSLFCSSLHWGSWRPVSPGLGPAWGQVEQTNVPSMHASPTPLGVLCSQPPLCCGFLLPISLLCPGPVSPQGLASPPSLHPAMMTAAVSREPWFRAQTLRSNLPGFKLNGLGQACCPTSQVEKITGPPQRTMVKVKCTNAGRAHAGPGRPTQSTSQPSRSSDGVRVARP